MIWEILGAYWESCFLGSGDHRSHYIVHDVKACLTAAADGLFDDLAGQAVDLNVHLDGCDSLWVPPTLKSMSPKKSSRPWISVSTR